MQHMREYLLAIGLVLGCVSAPALAQPPSPSSPPKTLWSFLGIPQISLDNDAPAVKRQPALKATANWKKVQPGEAMSTKSADDEHAQTHRNETTADDHTARPLAPHASSDSESAAAATTASASATNRSSRRTAILKRESARTDASVATAKSKPEPVNPPSATPHWTPRKVEPSAFLQGLASETPERPVAVMIGGDLLFDHASPTAAVARMDIAMGLAPSLKNHNLARSESDDETVAVKSATRPAVAVPPLTSAAQSSPALMMRSRP
jgi:hypothetical protein